MKQKGKAASTGHGSGALQPLTLRQRLARTKGRLMLKRMMRRRKHKASAKGGR